MRGYKWNLFGDKGFFEIHFVLFAISAFIISIIAKEIIVEWAREEFSYYLSGFMLLLIACAIPFLAVAIYCLVCMYSSILG